MKTINVKTSSEKDPTIYTMYAYNGGYGIEITHESYTPALFTECVKLNISVSSMFPGSVIEWNGYISDCVKEALEENNLTYSNIYGMFLKNQQ